MERVGSAGKKVEKTKQREPNHHILGEVERDNTPGSPEGRGATAWLSFHSNVLLIHFISCSRPCSRDIESDGWLANINHPLC